VGIFKRGKTKQPAVKEGDVVKRGQPIGYVEQLGTYVVVEVSSAGTVPGGVGATAVRGSRILVPASGCGLDGEGTQLQ
jgi:hypothetical protein